MRAIKQFVNSENKVFASISLDSELSLLMCIWLGDIDQPGQVAQVHEYCSLQVKSMDIQNWLSDVSGLKGEFLSFSGEAQRSTFEGLAETQLKHFAIVSHRSANPVRSAMINTLKQIGIEGRTFDSIPDALGWLTSDKSLSHNWGVGLKSHA